MKVTSISQAVNMTALQTLSAAIGKDKHERHAFIVGQVSQIIALALCKAPPKGIGNPADHGKLAATFAAAGLKNYAEHCAAFPQALKGRMRSMAAWADACDEGMSVAVAAFAGCAPKVYTADQLTKREADKAARKVAADKASKDEAKAAKALHRAELDAAFSKGAASVERAPITAQVVADLIASGVFSPDDVGIIESAIGARTAAMLAAVVSVPA